MKYLELDLVSWNRFVTRNFVVVPEVLGLACEFQFETAQIRVELPTDDNLNDETEHSKLRIAAYKEENGRKIPTKVAVKSVDVLVDLNRTTNMPDGVLNRHPNAIDLLSDDQQKSLNNLVGEHADAASRAFGLWIRVLRWKCSNGSIGRPEIHGAESGWGTTLLDKATRQRLWVMLHGLTLYMPDAVTLAQWRAVGETLKLGQATPIYIDSMFDGIEQYELGDLQRSVVDLAVACEAFMRSRVRHTLPDGLIDSVLKYIDEANVRQVLDHLYKDTLTTEEQRRSLKSINSVVQQLFNARNDILHAGYKADLTSAHCKKYIEATKKLIAIG